MRSTRCSGVTAPSSKATVALLVRRLTTARATPGVCSSALRTRPVQAAQCMPETGISIVRPLDVDPADGADGAWPITGSAARGTMSTSLRDERAVQHAHAARDRVPPLGWDGELDGGPLMRGEELPDPEVAEDDLLGAARRLLTVEDEPHGCAGPDVDLGGIVPAPHGDEHFLHPTHRGARGPAAPHGAEEVPVQPRDGADAGREDEPLVERHRSLPESGCNVHTRVGYVKAAQQGERLGSLLPPPPRLARHRSAFALHPSPFAALQCPRPDSNRRPSV